MHSSYGDWFDVLFNTTECPQEENGKRQEKKLVVRIFRVGWKSLLHEHMNRTYLQKASKSCIYRLSKAGHALHSSQLEADAGELFSEMNYASTP